MTSVPQRSISRSFIVAVTATALLGLPAAASATAATSPDSVSPTAAVAQRYDTSIRFLDFDHTRSYGSTTTLRGQVTARVGGRRGAVQGVRVELLRQLRGRSSWASLGTDFTSQRRHPAFAFHARSRANATYRVVYAGNAKLERSRGATSVSVYRHVAASLESGSGRFHGRVTPDYRSKKVSLQRRACSSCGWRPMRSLQTTRTGRYSFRVGAPTHGRTWWRVSTPATSLFIQSYSGVFSTRRS